MVKKIRINEEVDTKKLLVEKGKNLSNIINKYIDHLYKDVFVEDDWHYSPDELKGVLAMLIEDKDFTTSTIEEYMWDKMTNELDR
jgi:hypothetical protein